MVSARTSTPSAEHRHEPVRLSYRLRSLGRGQPTRLQAVRTDGRTFSEVEIKRLEPELHALDVAIVRELRAAAIFGQLADAQLARLIPLLAQRQTSVDGEGIGEGGRRLEVDDTPLRPRARLDTDANGRVLMTLTLAQPDGEAVDLPEGRLLLGAQAYFLRGTRAQPVESAAAWELQAWAAEPTQDLTGRLGADQRDKLLHRLARAGIPAADLEALAVRRGPPERFIATLAAEEGDDPRARLILEASYHGERVVVGGGTPASPYIVGHGDDLGLIERDLAAEEEARHLLRLARFRYDREALVFRAKDDAALIALDPRTDIFPGTWEVDRSKAPTFLRDLALRTQVELLTDRGLLDLSIRVDAVSGGAEGDDEPTVQALIEMKDLLAWLQSGKSYLRLPDGSFVAPSRQFRQRLRAVEDLGAESDRVLVSPLCVGLLRLLGEGDAVAAANEATEAWLAELSGGAEPARLDAPTELEGVLRDYQCRGLDWLGMLHRHRLTGILADDMGLGKTVQTLALLERILQNEGPKPSLVVAPTSVVTVWRDEAQRFTPSLRVGLLHGSPQARRALDLNAMDVLITSYGVLRRDADLLAKIPFRYVILDEAQAAKNAATQNARAVRRLRSERRLALTGTPIENRPEELWATFDFLAPGFLGSQRQFRKRYGRPITRGDDDALALLRARVQPLVLRRLKSEVAKELPPKIETTVRCDMDRAQRALYDHVAGSLRESVLRKIERIGIERAQLDILAALTRLRQICCDPALLPSPKGTKTPPSAKLALFTELMREALASERRVVVFSQFVKMQKRLIEVIKDLGVNPLWLHGGSKGRDKIVAQFQTPSGPPVIVVSLKAGGTGLTLTRADTVMHYDPWWNPAVERQATDRTHRLGQTERVTVYRLICADTIEERVQKMAKEKEALAAALIGSEGGAGAKMITSDDVLALLS